MELKSKLKQEYSTILSLLLIVCFLSSWVWYFVIRKSYRVAFFDANRNIVEHLTEKEIRQATAFSEDYFLLSEIPIMATYTIITLVIVVRLIIKTARRTF